MAKTMPEVFGVLPNGARDFLTGPEVSQGGVDGTTSLSWLRTGDKLLVWSFNYGPQAHVTNLGLPKNCGPVLVEFVQQASGHVSVVVACASASTLMVWPDSKQPFSVLREHLQGDRVTSLAAGRISHGPGGSDGVLAVAGFQNGMMQRVEVSSGRSSATSGLLPTGESRRGGLMAWMSSAVKAAYADTFYPTAERQAACSGAEVIGLRIACIGGTLWDLLVLTSDSLEVWKLEPITSAADASHSARCEVSHRIAPFFAQSLSAPLLQPICMSVLNHGKEAQISLLAGVEVAQGAGSYAVLRLVMEQKRRPSVQSAHVLGSCRPVAEDIACGDRHQLVSCSYSSLGLLLRQPGGIVWLVGVDSQGSVQAVQVPSQEPTLGCGLSQDLSRWFLLNASQGVLSARAVVSTTGPRAPIVSSPGMKAPAAAAVSSEARHKIFSELDTALAQTAAGQSATALGYTLEKLGAFVADGKDNAVAQFSSQLIDRLPKHWSASDASSGASAAAVYVSTAQQLEEKNTQHQTLIELLDSEGCLPCLRPCALRIIMENAEKLSALVAVRHFENRLPHRLTAQQVATLTDYGEACAWAGLPQAGADEQAGAAAAAAGVKMDRLGSFLALRGDQPLHEAVHAAGQLIQGTSTVFGKRDPWEVFYSRPSLAVPLLFRSIEGSLQEGLRATHQKACLAAANELLQAAECVLLHATSCREEMQRRFPKAVALARGGCLSIMPWVAGAEVREGLQALLECCLERQPPIQLHRSVEHVAEIKSLLFLCTDKMLAACAEAEAALVAAGGSAEELAAVREQYASAKHQALAALLEEAKWEAETRGVSYREVALMREVERLAEHHCSYPQLVDICEINLEPGRLHALMATCGPPGELIFYVMERLREEGRASELLDLPAEFNDQLSLYLKEFPTLRWKHELRLHQYAPAGATLGHLADHIAPSTDARRQALSLKHLCHLASAGPGLDGLLCMSEETGASASFTELILLDIQSMVAPECPRPMSKTELVHAALECAREAPEGYVWAMTVFAVSGTDFMGAHLEQLKSAWLQIALATDWEAVLEARRAMNDAQWVAELADTPLVQAIQQAYYQYGLEAQIPAEALKEWLLSEPALGGEGKEAAVLAVEFALSGGSLLAPEAGQDSAMTDAPMEQ